jgi:hypothetical protein
MASAQSDAIAARDGMMTGSRSLIILLIVTAAYPSMSQALSAVVVAANGSAAPTGPALWVSVFASLALALAVMAASFMVAQSVQHSGDVRGRLAAHVAFATPSLFVGFSNVANVWHAPVAALIAWPIFWVAIAAAVLTSQTSVRPTWSITAAGYRRLAISHGISASLIVVLFLAAHLVNHAAGLWSGMAHLSVMKAVRQVYRAPVIEPLVLALVAFQIASGAILVRRRLRTPSDIFGTLQSMTGVYVGIYFLAHLTAVFSARYAGTDTDWNWLTNHDRSMLASLSGLRLIGQYWFGPVAIATHLGCGLRMVLREHAVPPRIADLVPRAAFGIGAAAATVILVGLLGFHLG